MAPDPHTVARAADGPWNLDALTTRLAELGGWRGSDEIGWTAAALVGRWRRRPRLAPERLVAEIAELLAERPGLRVRPDVPEPRWRWPVTPWSDLDALALGLDLRVGELDWFADPGGWLTRAPEGPLQPLPTAVDDVACGRPAAAGVARAPLQELQRRVGRRGAGRDSVHDAAHGYVRGRSPHTLAAAHAGTPLVVRLDLEGFFAHVTGERVAGLLRTAGYPAAVAAALAGLLVTTTPRAVLRGAPPAVAPTGWEPRRRLLDRLAAPAPAAGRADLARHGQPPHPPPRPAAGRARFCGRRELRALRRRPGVLRSDAARARAHRPGHDDRGGGGLPGAAGQDARAARPPSSGRDGAGGQHAARRGPPRVRRPARAVAQLRADGARCAEPRRAPGVPRAPARPDRLGGAGRPARRRACARSSPTSGGSGSVLHDGRRGRSSARWPGHRNAAPAPTPQQRVVTPSRRERLRCARLPSRNARLAVGEVATRCRGSRDSPGVRRRGVRGSGRRTPGGTGRRWRPSPRPSRPAGSPWSRRALRSGRSRAARRTAR